MFSPTEAEPRPVSIARDGGLIEVRLDLPSLGEPLPPLDALKRLAPEARANSRRWLHDLKEWALALGCAGSPAWEAGAAEEFVPWREGARLTPSRTRAHAVALKVASQGHEAGCRHRARAQLDFEMGTGDGAIYDFTPYLQTAARYAGEHCQARELLGMVVEAAGRAGRQIDTDAYDFADVYAREAAAHPWHRPPILESEDDDRPPDQAPRASSLASDIFSSWSPAR